MSKVSIDLNSMTAQREGVVVTKYARKQIQDELKKRGIYGSTVWYEETIDNVMHFKITNPYLLFYRAYSNVNAMINRDGTISPIDPDLPTTIQVYKHHV